LRYLQHADFKRMRESITERRRLMQIAPHLVHTLECVMPTYGHALKGKEVMAVALFINDIVGFDRNKLADPAKHMPRGRVISKKECLERIPGLDQKGLTGGAIWYDCQVSNSERLVLAMLHSASEAGAVAANYVEMTGYLRQGDRVTGVAARDVVSGDEFDISARLVVNNTGPWFQETVSTLNGHSPRLDIELSAAMNLVVKKKLFDNYAVGLFSKEEFKDDDALLSKGSRLFFVTPWRDYSLIGTSHVHYAGRPGDFRISEHDISKFIQDVNSAYPTANLTRDDISFFYGGVLPADVVNSRTGDVKLLKSYQIIDHKVKSGLDGLLTVVSVKYTTARDVAEKTIDFAQRKLGMAATTSPTRSTPVYGGDIERFDEFVAAENKRSGDQLGPGIVEHLIANHGSNYLKIVNLAQHDGELLQPLAPDSPVLKAEVVHAVRHEMALTLDDVVRRRTILGSGGCPSPAALAAAARITSDELGWDDAKMAAEIDKVRTIYIPAS